MVNYCKRTASPVRYAHRDYQTCIAKPEGGNVGIESCTDRDAFYVDQRGDTVEAI